MKTAIIVHGLKSDDEYFNKEKPSPSNADWLPWIQKSLCINCILAQTPEMPEPYRPNYDSWAELFERFEISADTTVVGHSLGAGFIIRWLSEHPNIKVGTVALVAPWIDTEDRLQSDFFKFELDPQLAKHCRSVTILHSDNDMERINLTIALCKAQLKDVTFVELKGHGHFLKKHMGTEEFPELLDAVLAKS